MWRGLLGDEKEQEEEEKRRKLREGRIIQKRISKNKKAGRDGMRWDRLFPPRGEFEI